jgi:site-specific DNA-cytosine methylase
MLIAKRSTVNDTALLASMLTYIETFLPMYAVIKNVPEMDPNPADSHRTNACAQAICCLVGLGYQVRKMYLAADEYGSPTSRQRPSLVAAAPDIALPEMPATTHGCGRDLVPTIKIRDVLKDVNAIHNDAVMNVKNPIHIPAQRLRTKIRCNVSIRNVLSRISKRPGSNLHQAYQEGHLNREQLGWFIDLSDKKQKLSSNALQRVNPAEPF